MLTQNDLNVASNLIGTENTVICEFEKLLKSVSEPQLKTEFQNVISSHRNHKQKLIRLIKENAKEQSYEAK